jgi:hypothetical protein
MNLRLSHFWKIRFGEERVCLLGVQVEKLWQVLLERLLQRISKEICTSGSLGTYYTLAQFFILCRSVTDNRQLTGPLALEMENMYSLFDL